jgi:hypothetical protein
MGFDNEQISHDHVATFTKEEDISSRHGSSARDAVLLELGDDDILKLCR